MKVYKIVTGATETENGKTRELNHSDTYLVLAESCEQVIVKINKSGILMDENEGGIHEKEYIDEVCCLGTVDVK